MNSMQMKNLYDYLNELGSDAELVLNTSVRRGFSSNMVCATGVELEKLGIPVRTLSNADPFYEGTDIHYGNGTGEHGESVHVFNKETLKTMAYGSWQAKQDLKAANKSKAEIGA